MSGDVSIVIGAEDKASQVIDNVANKVGSFSSSFSTVVPVLAGVTAAIAGAAAGFMTLNAAVDGVMGAADKIDALTDVARGLGTTVDDLQAFQFAMNEAGNVSAEKSIDAIKKMQKAIGEAATGSNQKSVDVLEKLGIDARELSMQGPIDQFMAVKEAIGGIENVAERAAVAQELLGKSASDLVAALISEQDEFEASMQAANDLGVTVSDEAAAGIASMNDAIGRVSAGFEGIFNQVAIAIAPAVETVATTLSEWLPPIIDLAEEYLPMIIDAFAYIADTVNLTGGKSWTQGIEEARQRAAAAGEDARRQAEAIAEASAFVDKEAEKQKEIAAKKAEAEAKRALEKQQKEAERIAKEQAKKIQDEAERIDKLKQKELQNLEKQRIELTRGKEAAQAYALEMEGLDKATAKKIASDQAALDLVKAQKVDASQAQSVVESRLLLFGRGGDPKLQLMQEMRATLNDIKQSSKTTADNTSSIPLSNRSYKDYQTAVVP